MSNSFNFVYGRLIGCQNTLLPLNILLFLFLMNSCAKDDNIYDELSFHDEVDSEIIDEIQDDERTEEESLTEDEIPTNGFVHPVEGAFYVTANGSQHNSGTSESGSWSLSHAVANARAGDVIYIKAGEYRDVNLTMHNSGTADRPIIFLGYKDTPGDIDVSQQDLLGSETRGRRGTTRLAGGAEFDYKSSIRPAQMPLLRKSYKKNDIAIRIEGDFIEIQNLAISGYDFGMLVTEQSSNLKVWNCIFHEQGNMNVGYRDSGHPDRYQGTGFDNRGGQNVNIQFCSFLNPEQNALQFSGANSGVVSNNVVYSYNQTNGTDYMFLITRRGGTYSSGLTFEYNKCERVPGVPHGGHGFIVKNGGLNNTFRYWEVLHTNIEVNFLNVTDNLFEKGILRGGLYDHGDALSYILVTNGANNNTFRDIVVDGAWGAVVMHDYDDGASNDPNLDATAAGHQNKFINLVAKNCQYGVIFSETGANSPVGAQENMFVNCTFFDVEYGIRSYMRNSGNAFYNSTFNTTRGLITNHSHSLNGNTIFENCHFNGASSPNDVNGYTANNNIGGTPMFVNPNALVDYNFDVSGLGLQTNSPLVGAGKDISNLTDEASRDFSGNNRSSFNIGAF